MAAAAWSASARTRAVSASSTAPTRPWKTPSAPISVSPAMSGATTIERMSTARTTRSAPSV